MNTIFIFVIWILWQKSVSKRYSFLRANKLFCNSYIIIVHILYFFMNTILWSPLCEILIKCCLWPFVCFLQFKQSLQFHFTIVQFLKLRRYNETKLSVKKRTVTNFLWIFITIIQNEKSFLYFAPLLKYD